MKKKIFVLIGLAFFLVIFQFGRNEFIEPNPDQQIDITPTTGAALPFRVSNDSPKAAKYLFLLNARNTVVMEQKRLREKLPYYYRIEIPTGKMDVLDYLENPIEGLRHCLSDELNVELNSLLSNAQICESPEIEDSVRTVHCKMNYTLPFAILAYEDSGRINLGEKNTACDYPTSLCGESHQKLIDWARKVLVGIGSKDLECH